MGIGTGGLLKTTGQAAGIAGMMLNQRDTLRDLKAAQENLADTKEQGVTSTLTPEMKEAMTMAMKNYNEAKAESNYGFSPEQSAAYKAAINRNQTNQITSAGEAGGGQMAGYVGAVASANKADNLLEMMSKDATVRLQKEQFASGQLSPVVGMSNAIQNVNENDTDRYTNLLREAGNAVSDLRMQKAGNRERIFNASGTVLYNKGAEKQQKIEQVGKAALNIFGGPIGSMAGSMMPSSNTQVPQIGSPQNTQYGSFSDYGTQIG